MQVLCACVIFPFQLWVYLLLVWQIILVSDSPSKFIQIKLLIFNCELTLCFPHRRVLSSLWPIYPDVCLGRWIVFHCWLHEWDLIWTCSFSCSDGGNIQEQGQIEHRGLWSSDCGLIYIFFCRYINDSGGYKVIKLILLHLHPLIDDLA